jgi:hypothetical protein
MSPRLRILLLALAFVVFATIVAITYAAAGSDDPGLKLSFSLRGYTNGPSNVAILSITNQEACSVTLGGWVIEVEGTNSHPNPASWPGPLILRGGCSSTIPIVLPALDLHGARAHWHWRVDCWGERDNWASKARATVESWPLVGGIIGKPPTYFVMSEWFPQ